VDDDDVDEFNPNDWASLMHKAIKQPDEDGGVVPAALANAGLSDAANARVFGADPSTWEGAGLPDVFVTHLRDPKTGYKNPTRVQQLSVPHILRGDDVLIRAETGSGKTLAYMCPILAALGTMTPRITREDGTRALVMVPTRELAVQVLDTCAKLGKCYHWVVCGGVMGGENKQKEKARLRKGVSVLVATPGRLLDHLRSTTAFRADLLRWLVLDEADRMLDVGFEEDLNAILADLNRRTEGAGERCTRCTALLSATLTAGTSRLADLAMVDPVTIEMDPEEPEYVSEDWKKDTESLGTSSKGTNEGGMNGAMDAMANGTKTQEELALADAKQMIMRMPEQLRHTAVEVPAKCRLAALAGLLAGWMQGAVPKVMVFLSSCESVEFHYRILSWLAQGGRAKDGKGAGAGDINAGGYSVFRLHGVLSQTDRRAVYQGFSKATAGVLLCTDVGARGLDFSGVGATVQVDPPSDPTTYVHRVGRTARLGAEGEAVLFLQPREVEYATVLGDLGVNFCAASVPAMLDVLDGGGGGGGGGDFERNPHMHPAAQKLQRKLHAETSGDKELLTLAKDAFRSYVRSYATFPSDMKHIFHVKRLHLGHVASAFGLKEAPGLIGKSATRERLQAAKDSKRKDAVKSKREASKKRKAKAAGKMAPRKAARGTMVGAA
jgi:ATP-dependent RNA helicase DDX31/DBP7